MGNFNTYLSQLAKTKIWDIEDLNNIKSQA